MIKGNMEVVIDQKIKDKFWMPFYKRFIKKRGDKSIGKWNLKEQIKRAEEIQHELERTYR